MQALLPNGIKNRAQAVTYQEMKKNVRRNPQLVAISIVSEYNQQQHKVQEYTRYKAVTNSKNQKTAKTRQYKIGHISGD